MSPPRLLRRSPSPPAPRRRTIRCPITMGPRAAPNPGLLRRRRRHAAPMHVAAAEPEPVQGAGAPGKKNKTVLGQLDFARGGQGGQAVKSIGRTPDNDIVISHPQVSSRHALLHRVKRAALRRGSGQRQRHLRARAPHRARAEGAGAERREDLHRPDAAADRAERQRPRGDRAGGVRRRSLGRPSPLRDRGVEPAARGARPRRLVGDEGPPRQRIVQGPPRRHDRAHGPLGRGQDHLAAGAQRVPSALQRHRPHQRGGSLQHLRQPPRIHRLRPAGRSGARGADGLRGGEVQRQVPPPAGLLGGRDRRPRRADHQGPRARGGEEPPDRQAREEGALRRAAKAGQHRAGAGRPTRSSSSSTSPPAASPRTTRRR